MYGVSYNLTRTGGYNVSITLAGAEISGSPYPTFTVVPTTPDAILCTASGTGTIGGYAGIEQSFSIVPRDKFSNLITQGLSAGYSFGVR